MWSCQARKRERIARRISGRVKAFVNQVARDAIEPFHCRRAFGAEQRGTWPIVSKAKQRGHLAWSCSPCHCKTFPTGAKPASHFGTHRERFNPSCRMAVSQASQSIDKMSCWGIFLRLTQWSKISSDFACSYSVVRSHDGSLRSSIQRDQPAVESG